MYWNEKIDSIKKRYTDSQFSVPHLNRKEIFRKIETKFIRRSADYYELNNSNNPFSNWWKNIKSSEEESIEIKNELITELNKLIDPDDTFWVVAEFTDGVMIYKANKNATLDLIITGRTWTNTFHLIQSKYDYLISFRIEDSKIEIKRNPK